jgi:hypothetical protein
MMAASLDLRRSFSCAVKLPVISDPAARIAANLFEEGDWAILEWRDPSDLEVIL